MKALTITAVILALALTASAQQPSKAPDDLCTAVGVETDQMAAGYAQIESLIPSLVVTERPAVSQYLVELRANSALMLKDACKTPDLATAKAKTQRDRVRNLALLKETLARAQHALAEQYRQKAEDGQ